MKQLNHDRNSRRRGRFTSRPVADAACIVALMIFAQMCVACPAPTTSKRSGLKTPSARGREKSSVRTSQPSAAQRGQSPAKNGARKQAAASLTDGTSDTAKEAPPVNALEPPPSNPFDVLKLGMASYQLASSPTMAGARESIKM